MKILLSIKPKYIEKIKEGIKKYEFRKETFKKRHSNEVFVYSSSPVQKIIGKFKIGKILEDSPERLWEQLSDCAGIEEKDFFEYFHGKTKGFAIEITDFIVFETPIDPKILDPNFVPPQSYSYVKDSFFNKYVKQGGCIHERTIQKEL
jgi:predicted transcriptional regulator